MNNFAGKQRDNIGEITKHIRIVKRENNLNVLTTFGGIFQFFEKEIHSPFSGKCRDYSASAAYAIFSAYKKSDDTVINSHRITVRFFL